MLEKLENLCSVTPSTKYLQVCIKVPWTQETHFYGFSIYTTSNSKIWLLTVITWHLSNRIVPLTSPSRSESIHYPKSISRHYPRTNAAVYIPGSPTASTFNDIARDNPVWQLGQISFWYCGISPPHWAFVQVVSLSFVVQFVDDLNFFRKISIAVSKKRFTAHCERLSYLFFSWAGKLRCV